MGGPDQNHLDLDKLEETLKNIKDDELMEALRDALAEED